MIDPIDLIEQRLHAAGKTVKRRGDRLNAQCPAHDDNSPSMSAAPGDSRDVILYCFAGCRPDDILHALNLKWTDFGEPREGIEQAYDYTDADGTLRYQVVRKAGKKFLQRRPDGAGGWEWNLRGVEPLLYHLPDVANAARDGHPVYITEGEKDADRLRTEGVVATCNSGGAGKFPPSMIRHLAGVKHVNIIADRDDAGLAHANEVAALLNGAEISHSIALAATGKDVSDHFTFGHGLGDFVALEDTDEPTTHVEPATDPDEPWPEPLPLQEHDRPAFPLHIFPDWITNQARQAATEMQLTPDLAAQLAITALSIISAGRVKIKVRGPWVEGTNTYLVTALPPSAGKSPTFSMMLGAVEQWEERLSEDGEKKAEDRELDRRHLEKLRDEALKKGEISQAKMHGDDLRDIPAIHSPRLLADDATPEKLVDLLHQQNGRLALVSTEGGLFGMMTGRYSDKANLDVYLGAWSGDTLRIDRVGRGTLVVRRPRLSIGLTVQPDVIAAVGKNKELVGRGLTARFMYVIPADTVGSRSKSRDSTYDDTTAELYARHIIKIAEGLPEIGAEEAQLELSPASVRRFSAWQDQREALLGPFGQLRYMAEWIAKCDSTTTRLAGLLHIADGTDSNVIDVATLERAIEVGDYWTEHAKAAFDIMGASDDIGHARYIHAWLKTRANGETITFREIHRNGAIRRVETPADLVPAIDILVEHGLLRQRFDGGLIGQIGRGKPSPEFDLHPSLVCRHLLPLLPLDAESDQNDHGERQVAAVAAVSLETFQSHFLTENVKEDVEPQKAVPLLPHPESVPEAEQQLPAPPADHVEADTVEPEAEPAIWNPFDDA